MISEHIKQGDNFFLHHIYGNNEKWLYIFDNTPIFERLIDC
jgi:hypothetical protein